MTIILDEAKAKLEVKVPLSNDEIAALAALVDTYPQPLQVLERLKSEFERLDTVKNSRSKKPSYQTPDKDSRDLVEPVILRVISDRYSEIGTFMGYQAISNSSVYLSGLATVIAAKRKETKAELGKYTTLIRRLAVMDKFQVELATIRDEWSLPVLPWVQLKDVEYTAPQDLIATLAIGSFEPIDDLETYIRLDLMSSCKFVGLDPTDGFGVAVALLAFNVLPEDLFTGNERLDVVMHFALQKAPTNLSRVRIEVDNFGLMSGALIALAYMDARFTNDTSTPESVREWIRHARNIRTLLGLNVTNDEAVDVAMENVGGRLSSARVAPPEISITVTPEMTTADATASFRFARSRLKQVGSRSEDYARKWDNWSAYDEQMQFYLLYKEEYARKPHRAIYSAMKRFNALREAKGESSYFESYDVASVDSAKQMQRAVKKIETQQTLRSKLPKKLKRQKENRRTKQALRSK